MYKYEQGQSVKVLPNAEGLGCRSVIGKVGTIIGCTRSPLPHVGPTWIVQFGTKHSDVYPYTAIGIYERCLLAVD